MNKTVSILGSTGSIGTQSLEVCEKHGLKVVALAAHSSIEALEQQIRKFRPKYACIYNDEKYAELKRRISDVDVELLCGMEGLCKLASLEEADIILNSVVGMVGLLPTLTAIEAGKDIALANKETLVAGGELVMGAAAKKGVNIYPVDSEHSAIFQCLQGNKREQLSKIILTASGGPFFGRSYEELRNVTKEQALHHPNWDMGNKITIDSATLMNKGLEFIEAKWLFDLAPEQIEIVVHRQSVVHSAVEYNDYSVIAQMGVPDMKIPIQYALPTPVNQMAAISVSEARILVIQPWDKSTLKLIEKAIQASDIGIQPVNDGNVIRLAFPQLTEDRRKELCKSIKKYGEECKVTVRSIRRDTMEKYKAMKKNSEITEDDLKDCEKKVQDLTDKMCDDIDKMVADKEKEIMTV